MIKNKCTHFNGVQNKTCKAGVSYDSFPKGNCLPCLFINSSAPKSTCDKFKAQTPEEIAAREKQIKEGMEKFKKLTPLIGRIKREHKGSSWQGVEVCPVCGGKLHMSHSSYNGHVHGRCETKDCVRWME